MARFVSTSSDEEDGEGPESCSFLTSKKVVQSRDNTLKEFHAREKEKKKRQNRERDRKQKERAENNVVRRPDIENEGDRGGEGEGDDERDSGKDDDSDDEDGSRREHPIRLPDHVFISAFAAQSSRPSSSSHPGLNLDPGPPTDPRKPPRKRKREGKTRNSKDVIVGSRVIRTLDNPSVFIPPRPGAVPVRRVRNFVDQKLGLKGEISKKKGWTRKPANIGVLKPNGPPVRFARSS